MNHNEFHIQNHLKIKMKKLKNKEKNKCIECNSENSDKATRCKYCYEKGDLNIMKNPEVKKRHLKAMNRENVKKNIGMHHWSTKENAAEIRKKLSEKLKGRIITVDMKRRISEKQKGIPKSEDMKKRIKATCLIIMNTPEVKQKVRERTTYKYGKENHFWKGRIQNLPYDKNFNKQFKKLIILRDNNCLICGCNTKLNIHHVDYNKLNSVKENCCCLCNSCHSKTNFNRKYWIEFFHSLLIDKYKYFYIINKIENK